MGSLVSNSVAAPNACCGNIPPNFRSRSFAELIQPEVQHQSHQTRTASGVGLKESKKEERPGQCDPISRL